MKCKNAFSPSADDPGISCGPGITEQHHKDRVDINNIINGFSGIPVGNSREPMYGDFTEVGDFFETQLKIKQAEETFMSLDPQIRKRFANEPGNLIQFLQDPENRAEAEKLGLVVNSKPITPVSDQLKTSEPSLDQNSKQIKN